MRAEVLNYYYSLCSLTPYIRQRNGLALPFQGLDLKSKSLNDNANVASAACGSWFGVPPILGRPPNLRDPTPPHQEKSSPL